jgi:hypothetical protein
MAYIVKQKIHGKVYIYRAENIYRPELKQSRQERIYLGTLEADGSLLAGKDSEDLADGDLALLEKAGVKFRGGARRERVRCKCGARLVEGRCSSCSGTISGVDRLGATHALGVLAEESGLSASLKKAFGSKEGGALLALALHRAATGKPLYAAEAWLEGRLASPPYPGSASLAGEACENFDFSSGNLSRLMRDVGGMTEARGGFLALWGAACGKPSKLICDITSISSHSERLSLVEWGYNRDCESLPQVNLAMVSDAATGRPLAYRLMPGSIPDVSALSNTTAQLKALGFDAFSFSLDKGFYSMANLRSMIERGIGFTIGVPFSLSQAQRLAGRHLAAMRSGKRSFLWNERVMRHVKCSLEVKLSGGEKTSIPAHLYYEPARAADQCADFEKRVLLLERKSVDDRISSRREAREWIEENARGLAHLFRIAPCGMGFAAERKPNAVAKAMKFMGFTLVATSDKDAGREEVLSTYRSRDRAEKLFDLLKNELDQRRLGTGDDFAAEGRIFLSFVALALRSELEVRMRKSPLLKGTSSDELLTELDKICSVRLADGRAILLEITRKQREILHKIGVNPPQIQ